MSRQRKALETFAGMAAAAVATHDNLGGCGVTHKRATVLLMASLRHLCDRNGWDHGKMQDEAHQQYLSERENEREPTVPEVFDQVAKHFTAGSTEPPKDEDSST